MKKVEKKEAVKLAMICVVEDAIEKGHTNVEEVTEYLKTESFQRAVENYLVLLGHSIENK